MNRLQRLVVAGGLVGGALLMYGCRRHSLSNMDALRALPEYHHIHKRIHDIAPRLVTEWQKGGILTDDEIAALLGFIYRESKYDLGAFGDTHLPGGSIGLLQFRAPTIEHLGMKVSDFQMKKDTASEKKRVLSNTARMAERFLVRPRRSWYGGGRNFITYLRETYGSDWVNKTREMRTSWWRGHGVQYRTLNSERKAVVERVVPAVQAFRAAMKMSSGLNGWWGA